MQRLRYGVSFRMHTAASNERRLAAGATCVAITALVSTVRSRAVQVDGSVTRVGNGVLVMPSTSMLSMLHPAAP